MHDDVGQLLKRIWSKEYKFREKDLDYLRGIFLIKNLIDTNDHYTYTHSIQVSRYAYLIGRAMNMGKTQLEELLLTALLHDIGKSRLSVGIILKKEPLTPEEYEEIKKHVYCGAEIVRNYKFSEGLYRNILYHHERWDGKGYPLGLKGKKIPLISRIVTVADSFDAMTTNRPYKAGMSLDVALEELRKHSNKQFDGEIVQVFINMIQRERDWRKSLLYG
ncbi:MAG: HD-GYP domain-containing protein [Clostridia bacterium]|nr:HD-GYP domain-containing protein [Clostridia bacterium]